jgi:hypothetical protein
VTNVWTRRADLLRGLAKLVDLQLDGLALALVLQRRQIHVALIRERIEEVIARRVPLPTPKDEIDPQMQILRNDFGFQRRAVQLHESPGASGGPRGQLGVVHTRAVLAGAQLQMLAVLKHRRIAKEFRNELLPKNCQKKTRGDAINPRTLSKKNVRKKIKQQESARRT